MPGENKIIRRIRQGDIKSFETLFRSSYVSLVKYAGTLVKDQNYAEEIVQELFIWIWQEREKLVIKSSLNGYLFRAVRNRCLHHIGHRKVEERYATDLMAGGHPLSSAADEEVNYNELQEIIAGIMEKLPEKCGKIFIMSRFEGMKYSEIAEKLSVSVKTVEACMGKALKEFRKRLTDR